jgi:hypothetical protein
LQTWEATLIRTTLADAQWATTAPHCLGRECDPGRTGPDPRLFAEAVLWIARTGFLGVIFPKISAGGIWYSSSFAGECQQIFFILLSEF